MEEDFYGRSSKEKVVEVKKKRVCAYCRVSTSNEEQLKSCENQVSYYTNYIQSKSEWNYVDIYADEGISGTGIKIELNF